MMCFPLGFYLDLPLTNPYEELNNSSVYKIYTNYKNIEFIVFLPHYFWSNTLITIEI